MAESVKLNFNSIKNISEKNLKQFTVHRVVKICTESLEEAKCSSTAQEIFRFLLHDYILIVDHKELDGQLFKFVLPEALRFIKKNLEHKNITSLLPFLDLLIKFTNFMTTEVFPNNLEILQFEEFLCNSLSILKQLFLVTYATDNSVLKETTLSYHALILNILKSEEIIFFGEEILNLSDKFSRVILLLLDLTKIFLEGGEIMNYVDIWQFLVKLFINNSDQIVEKSNAVLVLTSNLNSLIKKQVEDLIESEHDYLITTINLNLKLLIRFSTVFPNENFRGHKSVLHNLVVLKNIQRRSGNSTIVQQTVHQVFVAYMVVLWNVFESDTMALDLSTVKFNNLDDILSLSELHLDILKKLTSDPNQLVMEKLFPNEQHNFFSTILQHISRNSCIFYKHFNLYEEFVAQLCGIMVLSAQNEGRFQFMEQLLVQSLLENPKVWLGMVCVDVWVLVARNLHTSQIVHYYKFCHQILEEIASPLYSSPNSIYFELLLQFFYKMINKTSFKENGVMEIRTKLFLGLEFQANKDVKTLMEEAKAELVVLSDKFICGDENGSIFDYREMILSLKYLTSSEITMDEEISRTLNELIRFSSGTDDLEVFGSLLCLLIDVVLVADEPDALNVPEIYNTILRNQNNLSFVIKKKVIQLMGKFLAYQDKNLVRFHTQLIVALLEDDSDTLVRPMLIQIFLQEKDKEGCQMLLQNINRYTSKAKFLFPFLMKDFQKVSEEQESYIFKNIFMENQRKFVFKHDCVVRIKKPKTPVPEGSIKTVETKGKSTFGTPHQSAPRNISQDLNEIILVPNIQDLDQNDSILIKRSFSDDENDDNFSYSPSATPIRKRQRLELSVNETLCNFLNYCQCMKNNPQEFQLTSDNREKIQEIKNILMEIENN